MDEIIAKIGPEQSIEPVQHRSGKVGSIGLMTSQDGGSTLILRDAQLACTLTASLTEGDNQMSDQLFAAIRRGKVKPGMAAEFAKRVEAGALPVMKKMDGFKGYYLIAGVDDTIVAVSLFTNQTVAQSSTQKMMPWIKENLGPLLVTPTEPFDGTVLVSA